MILMNMLRFECPLPWPAIHSRITHSLCVQKLYLLVIAALEFPQGLPP